MGNKLSNLFKKRIEGVHVNEVDRKIVMDNLRDYIIGSQEYNNRYGCKISSDKLLAFRIYLSADEFTETVESSIKGNFIISNPDTFQEIIKGGINLNNKDNKDKYIYFCYTIHSKIHNWS
jgi:hypothetical protein